MIITKLLCEAIATSLNGVAFDPSFAASAVWSVPYEPQALAQVQVIISPERSQETELLNRSRRVLETHNVSLLLQQKVPDLTDSTLDPLAALQTAISDHLRLSGPLVHESITFHWQAKTVTGFVRRHLEEYRVYTGFLDLTYLTHRS